MSYSNYLTDEMRERSRELRFRDKKGFTEIKDIIAEEFYPGKSVDHQRLYEAIRSHCRGSVNGTIEKMVNEKQDEPKAIILDLLKRPHHIDELKEKANIKQKDLLKIIDELKGEGHFIRDAHGVYQISREVFFNSDEVIRNKWNGDRVVKIGIVSDTHFNSHYVQITSLHQMYDIFATEKIKTVYHAGDMDEGEEMRVGHKHECYTQGADDHLDEIVKNYPQRDGITTYFLTGNHDHSLIKRAGFNIGNAIAGRRKDMVYLNADYAKVMLTPNYSMELRHPADGSSYALSYKPQKMIEAMGKNTPNLVVVGHYHKQGVFQHRGVQAILAGTFEGQSSFMRNKSLEAHIGGWIIEVHVDEEGNLKQFIPRFFPFDEIQDDWKRWR